MALKIAILASGSGTNAQSMIDKAAQGVLDIDIRLIAGNRPGAKVFERAEKAGIPHVCIDHKAFADRESFDREMMAAIKASGAEYVVLAGYMRLLTSTFLQAFPRELNEKELCQISTFPLDYKCPNPTRLRWLTGMSVPPVMMAHIAHQIHLQLFSK